MIGGIRSWGLVTLLLAAGCDEATAIEDVQAQVEDLCAAYCPLRIRCVDDGWAGGSVNQCVRLCGDVRQYERGGEPAPGLISQLECLASLSCEELPAAVRGGDGAGSACAPEPVEYDSAASVEE